jgi:hypothetical protein
MPLIEGLPTLKNDYQIKMSLTHEHFFALLNENIFPSISTEYHPLPFASFSIG